MTISDKKLWDMSVNVYKDASYGRVGRYTAEETGKIIDYSGKGNLHSSYESHGLQASLIKVNGQYVVAARGTSGAGDAKQDFDLTDPDAYQKESQFKDFQQFIEKMHRLHPDFDPQKATYTGHSLGAALATYAAVHYDAKATVFSAPSAYNELTPQQRAQVRQGKFNKKIKNIKHANDIVPDLPGLVPPIGKQVYIFNKNSLPASLSDLVFTMINAAGHLTKTFSPHNFDESGAAIAVPELPGAILHAQSNRYSLGLGINLTVNYFDLVRKEYSTGKRLAAKLQSGITDTAKTVEAFANSSVQAEKIALQKDSVDAAIASLKTSKEPLKNIKKINNQIYPDMQKRFQKIIDDACNLPYITPKDVAEVVERHQLEPKYHVDLDKIEASNQLVDQNLARIDNLIKGLKQAAEHIEQDDKDWAVSFVAR